ncbi:MAG: glycogen synthase GlgA [Usitatibacter sp.]
MTAPLKILFATSECAPVVKTGGLGDVSAALPFALRELGLDVRVLLPGYPSVLAAAADAPEACTLEVLGFSIRLLDARLPSGVPLLVADCPKLYARGGGPYQADDGDDWDDNAVRFGVFSRLAAVLGSSASPLDWRPDVVHCNDWPTALAPVYMHFDSSPRAASLITIHNLAFQGQFEADRLSSLAVAPAALGMQGMEFYGRMSFLKGALVYADAINTVSPTYAREIQGQELGFGLDGVLRSRSDRLYGVLNGIDTALWNPLDDPHIPNHYGPLTLERKPANKRALRTRMGLNASDKPLAAMVSRLSHQKGIDLLASAADALIKLGVQVAVVGTGDRALMEQLQVAAARHPGDFAIVIAFDEALAHLIEAGADMFLMPSRFEPCGMNQMYSQRYGTPPIANATGGLFDTVFDDGNDATQTGFLMRTATPEALVTAVGRAVTAMKDPKGWRAIQLHGMAKDFGWDGPARKYREIYQKLVSDTTFAG